MGGRIVTINSRKFDGKLHRTWKANFVEQRDALLKFVGEFEKEVKHSHLDVIRRGTISHEFYWLDRCYNVFRFHEPGGDLRNFYCNLNLPPSFDGKILDYVDLDIDVVVWNDFSVQILDLDEFAENSLKYSYSNDLRSKIKNALDELLGLIERREFPFDYKF